MHLKIEWLFRGVCTVGSVTVTSPELAPAVVVVGGGGSATVTSPELAPSALTPIVDDTLGKSSTDRIRRWSSAAASITDIVVVVAQSGYL